MQTDVMVVEHTFRFVLTQLKRTEPSRYMTE